MPQGCLQDESGKGAHMAASCSSRSASTRAFLSAAAPSRSRVDRRFIEVSMDAVTPPCVMGSTLPVLSSDHVEWMGGSSARGSEVSTPPPRETHSAGGAACAPSEWIGGSSAGCSVASTPPPRETSSAGGAVSAPSTSETGESRSTMEGKEHGDNQTANCVAPPRLRAPGNHQTGRLAFRLPAKGNFAVR